MLKKDRIINKFISLFLSSIIVSYSITCGHSLDLSSPKITNNTSNNKEAWIKKQSKKIGISAGITAVGALGILLIYNKYKAQPTTKNLYTPQKKEGVLYWEACLEGLYKYHQINNINQKYIRENFYSNNSYFSNLEKSNYKKYKSNMTDPTGKFSTCVGTISANSSNELKNNINTYIKNTSNVPFAISINKLNNHIHYVNIIEIKNGTITIEDPKDGMSQKVSLNDFCTSMVNSKFMETNVIKLFTIIPKENRIKT